MGGRACGVPPPPRLKLQRRLCARGIGRRTPPWGTRLFVCGVSVPFSSFYTYEGKREKFNMKLINNVDDDDDDDDYRLEPRVV